MYGIFENISIFALTKKCPDGGIGRRAGLKHQWIHFHAGSIPALGTEAEKVEKLSPFFIFIPRNSLVC